MDAHRRAQADFFLQFRSRIQAVKHQPRPGEIKYMSSVPGEAHAVGRVDIRDMPTIRVKLLQKHDELLYLFTRECAVDVGGRKMRVESLNPQIPQATNPVHKGGDFLVPEP